MANKDLRDWIAGVKAAGELKYINGAEMKIAIEPTINRPFGLRLIMLSPSIPPRIRPGIPDNPYTTIDIIPASNLFK
jgi:hypothetical protein